MKLNEIIVEREQRTDELLGGIAKGAGKVLGGVAKGVGAVAGIGAGMKKAFQKGKQASIDVIGGTGQGADSKAPTQQTQQPQASGGGSAGGGAATGGGLAAAFQKGVNNPTGGGAAQPQQAQGGTAQTPQPQAQQAQGDAAPEEPKAEPNVVQDLQKRITALDKDSQREVLQLLQKSAKAPEAEPKAEPAAGNTAPPAPAADTTKPANDAAATDPTASTTEKPAADQAGGKLSPGAFGKMATDLAGGAQKTADAKPQQQTNQPAPQPNSAETPAPTAGNTAQQDLKAKLKAGQGLAKTSGSGYKQGMIKGNMRLGAGRGGVTMDHTPEGEPIVESTKKKQWILFRS
jgi:hypothetical protein